MGISIGGIPHPFQGDQKCEGYRDLELVIVHLRGALSPTIAFTGRGECGGSGELEEYFRIRPIWVVCFAITNIHKNPIYLESLICNYDTTEEVKPRVLNFSGIKYEHNLQLPKPAIAPGETVLIPLLTTVSPLKPAKYNSLSSEHHTLSIEQRQTIERVDMTPSILDFTVIGPSIMPHSIIAESNKETITQPIHELDFNNLYLVNRHWMVGSCPHLFVKRGLEKKQYYIDEVFSDAPGLISTYKYIVPNGVRSIVIAELEYEMTNIQRIIVNKKIKNTGYALYSTGHMM